MAILSFDINVPGMTAESPSLSYFSTTDTVAQVTTPGYLNAFIRDNHGISVADMCLIRTQASASSPQAVAWYSVSYIAPNYILSPGNSPLPTIPVTSGGTGLTSLVPFEVMIGGPTSTSNMGQVSGVGAAGEVLTSAGAGLPPVWGTAGGSGAPSSATYITQTPNGGLSNEQALSLLANGLLKNATTTGVLSIAADGTDYFGPASTIPIANGGTAGTTASAARTNLGLAIGTNVQAYNASLQSISGLTTAANEMIYTTGSNTWATTPIAAYGLTLLNDSSAAAARTTLGLGTISTQDASAVSITGGTITGITALTVGVGGTGATTFTAHAPLIGNGASAISSASTGQSNVGYILTSTGSGSDPTWQAAAAGGTVTSVSGTTNRITVTSPTTTPVIDISASYVGQNTITTLGSITSGAWTSSTLIGLLYGGTNAALSAVPGGIAYSGASAIAFSAAGSSGQVLLSQGASPPIWSTPTFPGTVGPVGTILRSDGTNYVATTATYPTTTSINKILYSSANNVIGEIASGNNSVLVTNGSAVPSISATLPNAVQDNITRLGTITSGVWNGTAIGVASGGTGAVTLTAHAPLVGNGTSAISAASTGQTNAGWVFTSNGTSTDPSWQAIPAAAPTAWTEETSTPVNMTVNSNYIANKTTLVTFNVPASVAQGSTFWVANKGTGLFAIQMNTGQVLNYNQTPTTSGGSITATGQYDSIQILCLTADVLFTVIADEGVLIVA